jgi:von Willebrand factor type A domain
VLPALGLGGLASPGAAQTTAAASSTPVAVVLDASDSMTKADAPGSRIDAAKRAIGDLVGALPDEARVGLMAFGTSTGPTPRGARPAQPTGVSPRPGTRVGERPAAAAASANQTASRTAQPPGSLLK